jgi:hypothetical protein
MATSFHRTQYGWKAEYAAGTERRSSRLAVSPTLSLPFSSIPWLTATTSVTANLSYYGQSLDPESGGIVDEPIFTRNLVAAIEMVGPVFYKLYYGRDGRARLKNIIEPYVTYSYDSPTTQSDRIVTNFGFFRYHQVSYGVTGRFLFKGADERAVEVFSLGLGLCKTLGQLLVVRLHGCRLFLKGNQGVCLGLEILVLHGYALFFLLELLQLVLGRPLLIIHG